MSSTKLYSSVLQLSDSSLEGVAETLSSHQKLVSKKDDQDEFIVQEIIGRVLLLPCAIPLTDTGGKRLVAM